MRRYYFTVYFLDDSDLRVCYDAESLGAAIEQAIITFGIGTISHFAY